jgi:hypothetical protein
MTCISLILNTLLPIYCGKFSEFNGKQALLKHLIHPDLSLHKPQVLQILFHPIGSNKGQEQRLSCFGLFPEDMEFLLQLSSISFFNSKICLGIFDFADIDTVILPVDRQIVWAPASFLFHPFFRSISPPELFSAKSSKNTHFWPSIVPNPTKRPLLPPNRLSYPYHPLTDGYQRFY